MEEGGGKFIKQDETWFPSKERKERSTSKSIPYKNEDTTSDNLETHRPLKNILRTPSRTYLKSEDGRRKVRGFTWGERPNINRLRESSPNRNHKIIRGMKKPILERGS